MVDDCSTDDTGEVARRWGARVLRHEVNQGEAAARNTGLAAATQEWVALLDSDDEWLPHCLSTLWKLREGHLLVAAACLACPEGEEWHRFQGVVASCPLVLESPCPLIYPGNFIAASGAMVRRTAGLEAGGYRSGLRQAADMDLWIRVLERGTGIASPEVVSLYHVHPGQVTQNARAMWRGHELVARSYADRPWWRPHTLERWRGAQSWDALRAALRARSSGEAARETARMVSSWTRISGVIGVLAWRWRSRRRGSALARDGSPTVAIMATSPARRDRALEATSRRVRRELRAYDVRTWLTLARRPTGEAIGCPRPLRPALKALGITPVALASAPEDAERPPP